MAEYSMTRVESPEWADPPEANLEGVAPADYKAIRRHRARMLKVVHREVETYLNTPSLYFESDEDNDFPNRSRMTGEYYLGDESYIAHAKPVWFQISVMCRCLGKRLPTESPDDYLGLEVWLRCDPKTWSFTRYRNTDSSVI